MHPERIKQNIFSSYQQLEKGKKKHNIGDIVKMGPYWYQVIIKPDGKLGYKYYSKKDPGITNINNSPKTPHAPKAQQPIPNHVGNTSTGIIDVNGYEAIKTLGGSTGALLVRKDGKYFVRKTGNHKEHLRNEVRSLKYYAQMGADVPKVELYDKENGYAYMEYIEGIPLKAMLQYPDSKLIEEIKQTVRKHFVADVVMGNRDVVGMDLDNILIVKDSTGKFKAYRVDVGGSMEYRAQGEKKSEWGSTPVEHLSLLNPDINLATANIFQNISPSEIQDQLNEIGKAECIKSPSQYSSVLKERFNWLKSFYTKNEIEQSQQVDSIPEAKTYFFQPKLANSNDFIPPEIQPQAAKLYEQLSDLMSISSADIPYFRKYSLQISKKLGIAIKNIKGESIDEMFGNAKSLVSGFAEYAASNNMSQIEAAAIRHYTGSEFEEINYSIYNGVLNTDSSNLIIDKEHLSKYQVKSSTQHFQDLEADGTNLAINFLIGKLALAGIEKALQKSNSANVKLAHVYRGLGLSSDSASQIFKPFTTVAQCRFSSKSTSMSGYVNKNCRIQITAKGLDVKPISKHPGENEVLFHPFKPLYITGAKIDGHVTTVYAAEPSASLW